jgi:HSP20 family protein
MAESGAGRQRSSERSEREEQRGGQIQRSSGSMQRRAPGGYQPSILSITPRDFFTISPFGLMRRFTEEMDRVFSNFGGTSGGTGLEDLTWAPPVEIRESEGHLVISAELPGLSENDVRVEATPEGLVIQGERKQQHTGEEGGVRRSERVYGQFYRLIPLPDGANIENARANFENGVLQVSIPITESQQSRRQIPISSSQGQSGTGGQRARSASQSGGS